MKQNRESLAFINVAFTHILNVDWLLIACYNKEVNVWK